MTKRVAYANHVRVEKESAMTTPSIFEDRTSAKQVIARYWRAHDHAFPERGTNDYVIPHHVLRDYLDVMAAVRNAPGLHNITITVTRYGDINLLGAAAERILESDISIRMEGQKWA